MTRECGAEADADAGPVGVVVDGRRLAVGLSAGTPADATSGPDAGEATTIGIEDTGDET